jgi:hypothetical protein
LAADCPFILLLEYESFTFLLYPTSSKETGAFWKGVLPGFPGVSLHVLTYKDSSKSFRIFQQFDSLAQPFLLRRGIYLLGGGMLY